MARAWRSARSANSCARISDDRRPASAAAGQLSGLWRQRCAGRGIDGDRLGLGAAVLHRLLPSQRRAGGADLRQRADCRCGVLAADGASVGPVRADGAGAAVRAAAGVHPRGDPAVAQFRADVAAGAELSLLSRVLRRVRDGLRAGDHPLRDPRCRDGHRLCHQGAAGGGPDPVRAGLGDPGRVHADVADRLAGARQCRDVLLDGGNLHRAVHAGRRAALGVQLGAAARRPPGRGAPTPAGRSGGDLSRARLSPASGHVSGRLYQSGYLQRRLHFLRPVRLGRDDVAGIGPARRALYRATGRGGPRHSRHDADRAGPRLSRGGADVRGGHTGAAGGLGDGRAGTGACRVDRDRAGGAGARGAELHPLGDL